MSNIVIECDNLYKMYKTMDTEVFALQGLDLLVEEGEFLAVIGSSGSGKSTLLNMLGGLDKPTAGKLYVDGQDMFKLSEKQMREYKSDKVGFVWQNNARNLLQHLTALENVELVMRFSKKVKSDRKRAVELLEKVGMSHRLNSKLSQLSGGEQQRIAIAIALVNNPKILLADEPTGSVDTATSNSIFQLLNELNKTLNLTIVVVTHDMQVAHRVNRVVSISDGKINKELLARDTYDVALDKPDLLLTNIENADTHEEFLIVDRYGRVQIPSQFLEKLKISHRSKIKAKLEDDFIKLHLPL